MGHGIGFPGHGFEVIMLVFFIFLFRREIVLRILADFCSRSKGPERDGNVQSRVHPAPDITLWRSFLPPPFTGDVRGCGLGILSVGWFRRYGCGFGDLLFSFSF